MKNNKPSLLHQRTINLNGFLIENDLYQWAMNNGEVRTDDPDEFIDWLDKNLDDIVKGRIR